MKHLLAKNTYVVLLFLFISFSVLSLAANVEIRVDAKKEVAPISPVLYGLFFEDINYAADGGLYAELVQNRSFEYYSIPGGHQQHPLYAWEKVERGGGQCRLRLTRYVLWRT